MQRHFPGSLILKEEDFINLNVKYGLVVGRLSAYKGSVPDENIDEISKVMATAQALEANEYVNYSGNGSPLRYVTGMQVATHPMPINNDPFVFQVTPIGVMIHSKWGVEAEDNIFDNIKPL